MEILRGPEQFDARNYEPEAQQPDRDRAELLLDVAIMQADYARQTIARTIKRCPRLDD